MKVAIMQPYFCPYIGYFQLINSVDKFVIYDNIQYSKKGWFNRNRVLDETASSLFTIPIEKGSDYSNVADRYLADNALKENKRTLKRIKEVYGKAPCFDEVFPLITHLFLQDRVNLFDYIYYTVKRLTAHLGIKNEIIISSQLDIDHQLKSQDKVLEICKTLNAQVYINPISGKELYEHSRFRENGIKLCLLKSKPISYRQYKNPFIPSLSIIDVLMFNKLQKVNHFLSAYSLEE